MPPAPWPRLLPCGEHNPALPPAPGTAAVVREASCRGSWGGERKREAGVSAGIGPQSWMSLVLRALAWPPLLGGLPARSRLGQLYLPWGMAWSSLLRTEEAVAPVCEGLGSP